MFLQFKYYFLSSIVMLQKSTACLINWYKGRSLLVSLGGEQCFLVQTTLLQNSRSGSDSGIKETEPLCGSYLNCRCFPVDVWPQPLEKAACSSHICPSNAGDTDLQRPRRATLQLPGSSGTCAEPRRSGGRQEWGSTREPGRHSA